MDSTQSSPRDGIVDSYTIHTTASREQIEQFVRSLPADIVGDGEDVHGVGAGFRSRLAHTWFSLVAEDFEKLGRGEVGADGRTWDRNSPEYLAYGKGPKSSRMGRGSMPNNRLGGPAAHNGELARGQGTGDLNKHQLATWWQIYSRWKAYFIQYYDLPTAKAKAAQQAWIAIKRLGASTLLKRLGDRPDQVLVDRGTLRRSLQPGELVDYGGPEADYMESPGQLFEEQVGRIAVGSKTPYAAAHHDPKRQGAKKRSLWPDAIPAQWFEDIVGAAAAGIARIGELFR